MMRRWILASALAGMLGVGLGVSPACAQHTEPSEDDNRMGVLEPVDGTAESADHHAPEISWFSTGEDGEAPFAGRVLSFLLWAGILVYFGR